MGVAEKRVLLAGVGSGMAGMHLPRQLRRHEISCAAVGNPDLLLMQSTHLKKSYLWSPKGGRVDFAPFFRAVRDWKPDWVIPLDDLTVRYLGWISQEMLPGMAKPFPAYVVDLMNKSLGRPVDHGVGIRARCYEVAKTAKVPVPAQVSASSVDEIRVFAEHHGYPVVWKSEYSRGGVGVAIFANDDELSAVGAESKQAVKGNGVVQSYAPGVLGMHAVFAVEGRVLADVSALQVRPRSERVTSPSSVIRLCFNDAMAESARRFVAAAGISGFHGWDFQIADDESAVMIEHNPRPISITHLGHLIGADLFRGFSEYLAGITKANLHAPDKTAHGVEVALFPDEWLRDSDSNVFARCYHDAPWDDPGILRAAVSFRGRFL